MCGKMSLQVKNYLSEDIEEELYADTDSIPAATTTPLKVQSGKIRDGYDAIAVSVAVTNSVDCAFWLKIKDKQHYPDGLNCQGLSAGQHLNKETPLLVDIKSGEAWEIGFTSGAGVDVSWRFRLRLFKKVE